MGPKNFLKHFVSRLVSQASTGRAAPIAGRSSRFINPTVPVMPSKPQEVAVAAPTTMTASKTPYQLNLDQTTTACRVLVKHISDQRKQRAQDSAKPNLLDGRDDDQDDDQVSGVEEPIWLVLTTKKHIVDEQRLKPSKITLPHPINTSPTSTICLITAEPQRTYKDIVAHPSFPQDLRTRITRVIDLSKLKTKYKQFEARRKLFAEHDLFLADDRIVLLLPKLLGKVFYKSGAKRPVPVSIGQSTRKRDSDGRTVKKTPEERANSKKSRTDPSSASAASPEAVAREIERALGAALIHLAPGTSTSVKIARADFAAQQVAQNVVAVVEGLTARFVTKGWRNVRAVHLKGTNTMALPIWEASELWVDDGDVLEEKKKLFGNTKKDRTKAIEPGTAGAAPVGKRKADELAKPTAQQYAKKQRKAEVEEKLAQETALRKERTKRQKAEALAAVGTGVL